MTHKELEDTRIRAYAEEVLALEKRITAARKELGYARQLLTQVEGLRMDREFERDAAGAPVFRIHMPSGLYNCIVEESRK